MSRETSWQALILNSSWSRPWVGQLASMGRWLARMNLATYHRRICSRGVEGHHGWGKDAVNWYIEAHDTRTNMNRTGYSYWHHIYTDGYYQQGYSLGDAMGGDGQLFAGKIEIITEDNQRWSTRLVYAKVNPENQLINKAFPQSDTLKGVQLGWSGDVYQSVRLNTSLWYTNANNSDSDDVGASAGIEIPFSL